MIGVDQTFLSELVDDIHQRDQGLGIVQIGRVLHIEIQGLAQDASPHSLLALTQIDQNQGGVLFNRFELWRQVGRDIID